MFVMFYHVLSCRFNGYIEKILIYELTLFKHCVKRLEDDKTDRKRCVPVPVRFAISYFLLLVRYDLPKFSLRKSQAFI